MYPADVDSEELNSLLTTIKNQGDEITGLEKMVEKLQAKVAKETVAKKTTAKSATTKKAAVKKTETEPKKTAGRPKKTTGK